MEKYLEAGMIVNTHGVRGDIKAESWCDSPAVLAGLPTIYLKKSDGSLLPLKVTKGSVHKGMALLKLEGIDDINDAVRFKNMVIWADREDIPAREGSYFIADLIENYIIFRLCSSCIGNFTVIIFRLTLR